VKLLFLCHGCDSSPEWYHKIPDWEECSISGEPLSSNNKALTTACLVHPEMYRVIDKTFEVLKFLSEDQTFLGIHLENEPNLSLGRNLSDYGGNPHTVSAFRKFLDEEYITISNLNTVAGAQYDSFESIGPADSNWLVRVMAARFRAKLITGVYLTRAAKSARKYFPDAILVTRLQTGYFLKEWEKGHEINGMELTYLKNSDFNIIGWCNQWDTVVQDGMGQLNLTGGLLRGTGKILGFSEAFMQRFGTMHYSAYRPQELLHFVYRGLYYNSRMYNLHSWDREGEYVHDEPFGVSYLGRPGTLKIAAALRTELDRIRPFETFGKPVTAPLAIIVTRNARGFPGVNGWFYGNLLYKLCQVFEKPEFTCYEVVEECTSDVKEILKKVKGVVVADACLSATTRYLLNEFAEAGGKLLVFGAPSIVGPLYEPETLPEEYPVDARHIDFNEFARDKEYCLKEHTVISCHPVFECIDKVNILQPFPLKLREGSEVLVVDSDGNPVVAGKNNIIYCSGIIAPGNEPTVQFNDIHQIYEYNRTPNQTDSLENILSNFAKWCGVEASEVMISWFENATIVQNWDSRNHNPDGSPLDKTPWTGHVDLANGCPGGIYEVRGDHPWLAYHYSANKTVLEGVLVEQQDIKVFKKEQTRELMHLENISDTLGFSSWWSGALHPIIGRFKARVETAVDAGIAGGNMDEDEIAWFVAEVGGIRIAEGNGRKVKFKVMPGKDHYLTITYKNHKGIEDCPLCQRHVFE